MERQTVGVVGLGLMGASLCKALAAAGHRILGMDADSHVQGYALLTKVIEAPLDEAAVSQCDFLFLAVYHIDSISLKNLSSEVRKHEQYLPLPSIIPDSRVLVF